MDVRPVLMLVVLPAVILGFLTSARAYPPSRFWAAGALVLLAGVCVAFVSLYFDDDRVNDPLIVAACVFAFPFLLAALLSRLVPSSARRLVVALVAGSSYVLGLVVALAAGLAYGVLVP